METEIKSKDRLINTGFIIGVILLCIFVIHMYRQGVFASVSAFESYIESFGPWHTVIFIIIQIIQVLLPFMPSSVGCVVGIVLFGPFIGFIYNYFAICTGSIIDFLLSKRFGVNLVRKMIGKNRFNKYINIIDDENRFKKLLTMAILIPGSPDDFFCYIAGITKMKLKEFVPIILLGKPLSIIIFSLGTSVVLRFVLSLFKT